MPPSFNPTYALSDVQSKVRIRHYRATARAREGAGELGFDEGDITECVCALTDADFYKTMPSDSKPGTFQDVYRTDWCGQPVYLKVSLGGHARRVVIVSFKRDESAPEPE